MPTDTQRLDSMQAHGWRIEIHNRAAVLANPVFFHNNTSWYYVGPLSIPGKPWGVGPTLRAAIDDAIAVKAAHVDEDKED